MTENDNDSSINYKSSAESSPRTNEAPEVTKGEHVNCSRRDTDIENESESLEVNADYISNEEDVNDTKQTDVAADYASDWENNSEGVENLGATAVFVSNEDLSSTRSTNIDKDLFEARNIYVFFSYIGKILFDIIYLLELLYDLH